MIRSFCILLWLLPLPAFAAGGMMPDIVFATSNAAAPAYTGPGDIVASATAWWGLRAYDAAVAATGTTKAANLRRASDNTACDFDIATSGALGTSDSGCSLGGGLSLASFATQDATATCTISTTTATCTGASSTPHQFSTITGAGITQPCYAGSVGTFTSGAGTVTVSANSSAASPCGTISVGETLTFTYGLFVAELYDQTAHGYNVSQATAGAQPQLLPACLVSGTLPCMSFAGATHNLTLGSFAVVSQPMTLSMVAIRTNAFTTAGEPFSTFSSGGTYSAFSATANTVFVSAGTTFNATQADSTLHAFNALISGSSSVWNVDGTETTGSAGANATTANLGIGASNTGANPMTGYLGEVGLWPSGFSQANRTSVCGNQATYYSTTIGTYC